MGGFCSKLPNVPSASEQCVKQKLRIHVRLASERLKILVKSDLAFGDCNTKLLRERHASNNCQHGVWGDESASLYCRFSRDVERRVVDSRLRHFAGANPRYLAFPKLRTAFGRRST